MRHTHRGLSGECEREVPNGTRVAKPPHSLSLARCVDADKGIFNYYTRVIIFVAHTDDGSSTLSYSIFSRISPLWFHDTDNESRCIRDTMCVCAIYWPANVSFSPAAASIFISVHRHTTTLNEWSSQKSVCVCATLSGVPNLFQLQLSQCNPFHISICVRYYYYEWSQLINLTRTQRLEDVRRREREIHIPSLSVRPISAI